MSKPITHGYYRYTTGCRCDECKAANTANKLAYRRSKGVLPKSNPCQNDGRLFESQTALALHYGVSRSTVSGHLNRNGHLDNLKARS